MYKKVAGIAIITVTTSGILEVPKLNVLDTINGTSEIELNVISYCRFCIFLLFLGCLMTLTGIVDCFGSVRVSQILLGSVITPDKIIDRTLMIIYVTVFGFANHWIHLDHYVGQCCASSSESCYQKYPKDCSEFIPRSVDQFGQYYRIARFLPLLWCQRLQRL